MVDLSSGQNVDLNRFLEQSFPQIDGANDQYYSGDHRSRQAKRPRYDDPIEWSHMTTILLQKLRWKYSLQTWETFATDLQDSNRAKCIRVVQARVAQLSKLSKHKLSSW